MPTRSQRLAQKAIEVVQSWNVASNDAAQNENRDADGEKNPNRFARRFPALVQVSGLLPAVVFARDKNETYAEGFRSVLHVLAPEKVGGNLDEFEQNLNQSGAVDYMNLTRLALEAATWIKRYVVKDD